MQFSNSECKMSRRNAVLQFGMQTRNALFQFGMQNFKAVFQFGMQNAKAQSSFNSECKGAMQFPIRNAKCQGAMLIINLTFAVTCWEFKMKILCGLSHGFYFLAGTMNSPEPSFSSIVWGS